MPDILFENENKSIGSFPYIKLINENLNFISHYHEDMEVVYMDSGSITALTDSGEIALHTGDICVFMPGEIHSYQTTTDNNVFIIKMNINSYVENIDFYKIKLSYNKIESGNPNYMAIKSIIDEMCQEYKEKKEGYEFAIRYCKNKIISTVLRNIPYIIKDTSKNIAFLNSVNKYLEENYEDKIKLDDIANKCHFSKYYFAHKLKEMTGMTLVSYVTAYRLEKATTMLKNTNVHITEIALLCGFGNLRSFNRCFRSAYDMTPLKYRKSFKD